MGTFPRGSFFSFFLITTKDGIWGKYHGVSTLQIQGRIVSNAATKVSGFTYLYTNAYIYMPAHTMVCGTLLRCFDESDVLDGFVYIQSVWHSVLVTVCLLLSNPANTPPLFVFTFVKCYQPQGLPSFTLPLLLFRQHSSCISPLDLYARTASFPQVPEAPQGCRIPTPQTDLARTGLCPRRRRDALGEGSRLMRKVPEAGNGCS